MSNKYKGNIVQITANKPTPFDKTTSYFTKNLRHVPYSPFGLECKRILVNQVFDYGQSFSVDIPVVSNLLYRCFFEIDVPILNFTDSSITDSRYIAYKNNNIANITEEINYWTTLSDNMKLYSDIQISGYVEVKSILKLSNITISFLHSRILNIYNNSQDNIYKYKLFLDANIITSIDILSYILGLTSINVNEINTTIDSMYNNIINYLEYYDSNKDYSKKEKIVVSNGKILCRWIDYFAHYYFNYFELYVNGFTIDNYSNDYLHIKQIHSIDISYIDNYKKLIGNTEDIYINKGSPNFIYVPLLFNFNNIDESTNALPLVGMINTSIKINSTINNLQNLVYLQDWPQMYNNILTVDIKRKDHKIDSNMNTITMADLPYESIELILPQYIYRYKCKIVNKQVLDAQYQNIDSNNILASYGSIDPDTNEMVLTLDDWIVLMNNIKADVLLAENDKITLAGYHYFIDYNYILNLIPKPKISLLVEHGYIDEFEKKLMATSNLDYIVETRHQIVLTINDNSFYDSLNDIDGLVKDIYIFTRPLLNKNGISQYGKRDYTNFHATPNPIESIELTVSNEYNLFEYYDTSINSYNNVQSFYYLYSSIPIGVWYKTFSLNPNVIQPSGSVNMNNISGQNIAVIVNELNNLYYNSKINPNNLGTEVIIMYTKYNILKVKNGQANLLFYS